MRNLFQNGVFVLICFYFGFVALNAHPRRVKFKQVIVNHVDKTFNLNITDNGDESVSRVLVAITVKNHAYSLPTFLATLETLKCPGENKKCHLCVIFDNCTDKSYDIFTYWLSNTRELFDTIILLNTQNDLKTKQKHPELDPLFFSSNLKLRALKYGVDREFTHIFYLNADLVLINSNTVQILMSKKKTIVAPLLTSGETHHSTYWLRSNYLNDKEEDLFYTYYNREQIGCFKVNGVEESFLVDLLDKNVLKIFQSTEIIDKETENDVQFSYKARYSGITLYVCNRDEFGYVPDNSQELNNDPYESFIHLRMEYLLKGANKTYNKPLKTTNHIDVSKKRKTKLGFDQIYIVNLERRSDRRERIEAALDDLNISFNMTKAVDSQLLTEDYLKNLNINVVPNYIDPYNERSINYGEIACFLSHYNIWQDMIEKKYEKIIILEDDARFAANFKTILAYMINEMKDKEIKWDLLYLGRKIMKEYANFETWNYDIKFKNGFGLRKPHLSHWTIGYALTLEGAQKLVSQDPLTKIVPIDEYLPIMYDKQPNEYWSSFYSNRDLIAYAIQPSIVMPTHYFGEPNYVSDTEHTPVLDTTKFEIPKSDGISLPQQKDALKHIEF